MKATSTEMARTLAARRRRVTSHCAVCGAAITGLVTRRYCSPACRVRAARQRRRGQPGTPSIVERLNWTRAAIMRGRRFDDDSTALLRAARAERAAWS